MLAITSGWAVLSAAILARLGPTMATIWRATGVSMVVITAVWQNAIVKGYALFQTAMVGMTVAWGAFMRGIWTAVAASWAVGLRSPYALMLAMTSGVMAGMRALMAAHWVGIQNLIVAAAYIAGAIWTTLQVTLATISSCR